MYRFPLTTIYSCKVHINFEYFHLFILLTALISGIKIHMWSIHEVCICVKYFPFFLGIFHLTIFAGVNIYIYIYMHFEVFMELWDMKGEEDIIYSTFSKFSLPNVLSRFSLNCLNKIVKDIINISVGVYVSKDYLHKCSF